LSQIIQTSPSPFDFIKLFDSFSEVTYFDEPHKYYYKNNPIPLISTTTFIHHFYNEFEGEYWAEKKSIEYGITKEQVLFAWDYLNYYAQIKGTVSHNYAENLMNRKVFPYPKNHIIECFGHDAIDKNFLKIKKQIDSFYQDSLQKIIPLKTEYIVYDLEYGLSGMVDLIVFNKKTQKIEIWDYKTSRAIKKENRFQKMKTPIMDLDDCEFTHYGLQLNIYKHIIEKNTGLKLGDCRLIWINEVNDNYQFITLPDMSFEIKQIIEHGIDEGILVGVN
jgi:hypothetical protein